MGYPPEWTDLKNEQMYSLSEENKEPDVLQSEVLLGTQNGEKYQSNKSGRNKTDAETGGFKKMRTMQNKEKSTEASQRQQSRQYESKEHSSSMPDLPQKRTHENRDMGNFWAEEPNTPRIAIGVKNRVSRLKGLGNSIIPQIAELLFKKIESTNV